VLQNVRIADLLQLQHNTLQQESPMKFITTTRDPGVLPQD